MRMRNLLMLLAIVLFVSSAALAQRTPPAPSAPPSPSAPPAPPAPMTFFYSDGGAYLGIVPENINRENMSQYALSAPRGVGISSVSQGSPAEKAGLRKGDVILQFDGEPVASTRKLLRLIGESAPDHTVRLLIIRNGSEQQVTATLGQREDMTRSYRAVIPGGRAELMRPTPVPRGWSTAPEAFTFFGNNRRIGITTNSLTKQLADYFGVSGGQGLLITSVSENSPASRAGLRAGDIITEVNGEKIDDSNDFIRALNYKEEGEVTLTIIRDKSQRTIKVTPERRQTPTFNLSELAPAAMLSQIPQIDLQIPDVRILQTLPKMELPALPKIELQTIPKMDLRTLPRIEQLQVNPGIL